MKTWFMKSTDFDRPVTNTGTAVFRDSKRGNRNDKRASVVLSPTEQGDLNTALMASLLPPSAHRTQQKLSRQPLLNWPTNVLQAQIFDKNWKKKRKIYIHIIY